MRAIFAVAELLVSVVYTLSPSYCVMFLVVFPLCLLTMATVSQAFLVFRALTVQLALPAQLEIRDFQVRVDFEVQPELLDFLDRLDQSAGKEIGEIQDLPEPQVIFLVF